jgi:hypothetical protein
MRLIVTIFFAFFAYSGAAQAWGDMGHEVICEIAIRSVSPSTRAEVQEIMREDTEFPGFPAACTWPDHPRKRAAEHFLNLPRDSNGLVGEDCGESSACVVTAIRKDMAVLSSRTAAPGVKLTALKYLGHWVGDIHQPLHVSFSDDRGGNDIHVSGQCGPNLHSAWDTCLVKKAVGDNVVDAATELMKTITPDKLSSWIRSDPMVWANESFALAERASVKYCVRQGPICARPSNSAVIDGAYVDASTPVIREQLQKAGVRLAHLLDEALRD